MVKKIRIYFFMIEQKKRKLFDFKLLTVII